MKDKYKKPVNLTIERKAIKEAVKNIVMGLDQIPKKINKNENLKPGVRCTIIAPKNQPLDNFIKTFIGQTGTILKLENKEKDLWRIKFDNPVIISGVNSISEDLFHSKFIKVL